MSGGKDGQTLFHRILPATARGLASTTAVDWYLKVKNKKCNVGLTKNYSITVSMQKIRSIINLFSKFQGLMNYVTTPIFNQAHPEILGITFSFPEFAPPYKKSVHSINSFLRYSQFQSPVTRLTTPISGHANPKTF